MKKQGILKIVAGMMLIATTTACGSSSAGVKNVDLKDPDGDYHVQVDFKTNEVTLSCDVENDDTGTGEGWSAIESRIQQSILKQCLLIQLIKCQTILRKYSKIFGKMIFKMNTQGLKLMRMERQQI